MAINTGKVVVGGLAGGVALAALDFLVNGVVLAEANARALNALNPAVAASMGGRTVAVAFILIDLLLGILLVWTYAAMRPRFGPGPKTATIVGVQAWAVSLLPFVGMTFMGMWTWDFFMQSAVAFLVMMIFGANIGAMLYKENV